MKAVLFITACYLVGAIPTAYIFAKILKGIDIRQHGSGNVGSTNAMRVLGKLPGIATLVIDMLKGFIMVIVANYFAATYLEKGISAHFFVAVCALAIICGHNWPVYIKFKGGKGVATTCGVFFAIAPVSGFFAILIWIGTLFISKYVSLSSLAALGCLPLIMKLRHEPSSYVILSIVLFFMTAIRHRSNIARLLKGQENKISSKNTKK